MELTYKLEWEVNGITQSAVIDEPVGFDSLEVQMERHDYHGIGAEASLGSLEFYGQAAEIISQVYNTDIETSIWYEVSEPVGQRWLLDLSTYSRKDGNYTSVSCKVCEEGVKTIFNNRTEIDVDLQTLTTIDGEELQKAQWKAVNIPTKHLRYTNTSNRTADQNYTHAGGQGTGADGIYNGYNAPYLAIAIGNNTTAEFGSLNESQLPYSANTTDYIEQQYVAGEDHETKYGNGTKTRIEINLYASITRKDAVLNSTSTIYIYLQAQDTEGNYIDGRKVGIPASAFGSTGATQVFNANLFGVLNASSAIRYYLVFEYEGNDWMRTYINVQKGSSLKMTMYDKIEDRDTLTSAIMVQDALDVVTRAISENSLEMKSEWYKDATEPGGGALKCLTNGYKIRGLYSQRNMPISFKGLLTSLNALDCVGWGFSEENNKTCVRVERWDWFYKDNLLLDIDNVDEMTIEAEPSQMITELTIGYKKYATTSQYNSIDSPHGTRVFANSNKVAHEAISKECDFIADNYAIEETRRSRTLVSETEETTYDENIFVLELTKTTSDGVDNYKIEPTAVDVTGINRPEEFINAKLTPRHMAARWQDYIFQSNSKTALRFMSGEINYEAAFGVIPYQQGTKYSLESFAQSTPQKENEDIAYQESSIKAERISFSYPIAIDQYKTIKANPYGKVRVNGKEGWIKSFRYSFADGMAEFKLITKAK